jgi:4-aminobutyrate aminotransferase-like enzyme
MLPPLNVTEEVLDIALDILIEAIETCTAAHARAA